MNNKQHSNKKYPYVELGWTEAGHMNEPDPENMGRIRARRNYQGAQVLTEHLRFLQPFISSQHDFPRPPRPGQAVSILPTSDGYGFYQIIHGIQKTAQSAKGKPLDDMIPQLKQAMEKTTNINLPPKIESALEENRTGLQKLVKKVVEKGVTESQSVYKGVPSHGATPSMANFTTQTVKNVSTAMTEQSSQLTSDILSQLTGSMFSLGSVFANLDISNLPSHIQDAIGSLNQLMPSESSSVSGPGNFMIGNIVNPSVMSNILNTNLSNVSNYGQLENALQNSLTSSISSDAIQGLENLVFNSHGIFGEFSQTVSATGLITNVLSTLAQLAETAFGNILTTIPGAASQEKIFGNDSEIPSLIKRLKTQSIVSEAKTALEDKSPEKNAKRKKLYQGGSSGKTRGSQYLND